MKRAAMGGAMTALGIVLGIYAVYSDVRLDWPETALVCGACLFMVGFSRLMDIVRELPCDED